MSVFIDYSKAFETIQHEALIKKLANLNLSNSSIKIILSYLRNRQQYVRLDNKKSSYQPIYFGVAQGSIYDPDLFNIYVSSLSSCLKYNFAPVLFNIYVSSLSSCLKYNFIKYVDGTSLYLSNFIRNIQSTISINETEIKNLNTWSENNGLVFNNDELLSVLFTSKRTVYDQSYLIKSNGKSIKQKPTAKLLGITFDWNLTCNEHINILTKLTYGVLRLLESFKRFKSFPTRKCPAESLVL